MCIRDSGYTVSVDSVELAEKETRVAVTVTNNGAEMCIRDRQMVNHLVEVAVSMSDCQVQDMSWFDFLDEITEPELIQYLKERRLYVNEPVTAGAEEE